MSTYTVEELIKLLPEEVTVGKKTAFLEITKSHVYYSTKHDNKGNLNCVFVDMHPEVRDSLEAAYNWCKENGYVQD